MQKYDLLVIGAGPCGIAVGAAAARDGDTSALLIDKGCVTQSLIAYPYYMDFFSTAQKLEIDGVPFTIPDSKPSRKIDALSSVAVKEFVAEKALSLPMASRLVIRHESGVSRGGSARGVQLVPVTTRSKSSVEGSESAHSSRR